MLVEIAGFPAENAALLEHCGNPRLDFPGLKIGSEMSGRSGKNRPFATVIDRNILLAKIFLRQKFSDKNIRDSCPVLRCFCLSWKSDNQTEFKQKDTFFKNNYLCTSLAGRYKDNSFGSDLSFSRSGRFLIKILDMPKIGLSTLKKKNLGNGKVS